MVPSIFHQDRLPPPFSHLAHLKSVSISELLPVYVCLYVHPHSYLKSVSINELLPLPVRPTIPHDCPPDSSKVMSWSTGGRPGRYAAVTCRRYISLIQLAGRYTAVTCRRYGMGRQHDMECCPFHLSCPWHYTTENPPDRMLPGPFKSPSIRHCPNYSTGTV